MNGLLDRAEHRRLDCIAVRVNELNTSRADWDVRRQMASATFRSVTDLKRPDGSKVGRLSAVELPGVQHYLFGPDGSPIVDDDGCPRKVPVWVIINRDVVACLNLRTQLTSLLFRGRPYLDPLRSVAAMDVPAYDRSLKS